MAEIKTIADLRLDPKNARRRTKRSSAMLVDSLHEVGAARSIVIDENGVILAGNGTVEAAAEAGIDRVQVVDADGETIVAVRRSGLSKSPKVKLALYDNRTSELAIWDYNVIADLSKENDLSKIFNQEELAPLLVPAREAVASVETDPPSAKRPSAYVLTLGLAVDDIITCETAIASVGLPRNEAILHIFKEFLREKVKEKDKLHV